MRLKNLIFTFCLLIPLISHSQRDISENYIKKQDYLDSIPDFEKKYGINKTFPDSIKEACLVALSFFPELQKTKIRIKFKKYMLQSSMKTRPDNIILINKSKRKYSIFINKNCGKKGVCIDSLSFNAVVGVLGHELSHILDYKKRSNFNLFIFGIKYLFSGKFKQKIEKKVDMIAVNHGLFYSLYEFKMYIFTNINVPEAYVKRLRKFYIDHDDLWKYYYD